MDPLLLVFDCVALNKKKEKKKKPMIIKDVFNTSA